jgi:hypothetical protein
MKKIKIVLIFMVLFSCVFILGCSSSLKEGNTCIRLRHIDSVTYKEYYALWFPNSYNSNDTSGYYLLSKKSDNKNIDMEKYALLRKGETYCLKIFTVDSLVNATLNSRGDIIIIDPNTILYKNGKIMIKVYFSNDIKGKYVLKCKKE